MEPDKRSSLQKSQNSVSDRCCFSRDSSNTSRTQIITEVPRPQSFSFPQHSLEHHFGQDLVEHTNNMDVKPSDFYQLNGALVKVLHSTQPACLRSLEDCMSLANNDYPSLGNENINLFPQLQELRNFVSRNHSAEGSRQNLSLRDQQHDISQDEHASHNESSFFPSFVNPADQAPLSDSQAIVNKDAYVNSCARIYSTPELLNFGDGLQPREYFAMEKSHYRTQFQRECHILSERQRREEMNDKFTILRSLIPKLTKRDKSSIVAETINYIKELEKNLKYLEASKQKSNDYVKFAKEGPKLADSPQESLISLSGDELNEEEELLISQPQPVQKDSIGLDDGKLCQVEVQDLGHQAVIKILSRRSRGIVLRLHMALEECKVDVIQSNVTTVGESMVHFITVELVRGVSASIESLIPALKLACRRPDR